MILDHHILSIDGARKDVDGEGWDSYPASSTPEPPETKYIQEVGTLKATLNLDVIQDSQSFAVWDAVDGIIALAWENLDNYEEYPDSRLSFNFGAEKNKVAETLYEKDLFLNLAADNNFYLFLEHDAHNEIITVKHTEKGVRLNATHTCSDIFN